MIAYNDTLKRLTFRDNAAWRVMDTAVIVRKTADEPVNNSTALQNDDELLLAMAANEVWEIDLNLIFQSTAVAGLKLIPTVPAACVGYQHGVYIDTTPALVLTKVALVTVSVQGIAANSMLCLRYTVINGANAGNFQIQWAQMVAEATNTIVRANSMLIARKIA
jgi:hypothetical protein